MILKLTLLKAIKLIVFILCLVPCAILVVGIMQNSLGPNPVEAVLHSTGGWTLRFLLITLAMTPLKIMLGKPWPIKFRRMFGLFTFFYATLHFLTWFAIDQALDWANILADIAERPYVTVGFIAWCILLALAITSNRWSIRQLGKSWGKLHTAVYAAALLGILHFVWLVKADWLEPLVYGLILLVLLAFRLPWIKKLKSLRTKYA